MAIHVDAVRFTQFSEVYEAAATREPVIIYRDGIARHVLVSLEVVETMRARRAEQERDRLPLRTADRIDEKG